MYSTIFTYKPDNGKNAEEIARDFEASLPLFKGMPGLIRKYFCFDDEAMEGTSIYIWESREVAEAVCKDPEFMKKFKQTFNCEPSIRYTDVKLVADNS